MTNALRNGFMTIDGQSSLARRLILAMTLLLTLALTQLAQASVTGHRPQASALFEGDAAPGATVVLDASRSTDLDGNRLSYRWSVVEAPANSVALIGNYHAVRTSLKLGTQGRYVIRLDVSDGIEHAQPVLIVIDTATPSKAVASASATVVRPGQRVQLDGAQVLAGGDPIADSNGLTWQWAILDSPHDSTATLAAADTVRPQLRPERPGIYVIQAVAVDGDDTVRVATTTVRVPAVTRQPAGGTASAERFRSIRGVDTDGDGIADDADNCIDVFNPDQRDTNGDLFGNVCDPDLTNDFAVNFADLQLLKLAFFSSPGMPGWNPDADFNGDDAVNFADLQIMKQFFLGRPGPSGTLALLNCGDLEPRSIDLPGEGDFYRFTGTAGTKLAVTIVETSGFAGAPDPRATIYDPTGNIAGQVDANGQLVLDLVETGSYVVNVRANDGTTTGTYNIGLVCLTPGEPIVAALGCGSLLAGEQLDTPGQTKLYSFDGTAGDIVGLTIVETSGFVGASDPRIWLYSPTGQFIDALDANSQVVYTLTETGTYVVRVAANELVATGTFNIGLVCLNPAAPVVAALGCGDLLVDEALDAPGETKLYSFDGTAGDIVGLTIVETSGFVGASDPRIWLYSPTGQFIDALDANSQVVYTLTETGTYVVRVAANELVATGTFNIGLVCLNPAAPVVAALGCGDLLVDEALDAPGQTELYSFNGTAGDVVGLTIVETSGFAGASDPRIWLYSPTGQFIDALDANSQVVYTLTETGTYVVRVAANELVSTGTFNIGLVCLNPAAPVVAALGCGDLLVDEALDAPGQTELYSFDGTAGDVVGLTIVETSGFAGASDPRIWLYSPTGQFIQAQDANSQIVYTLGETGTYVVRVAANELVATGTFNIGLVCLSAATPLAGTLDCGDTLSDGLAAAGETDLFVFDATAGVGLTISLTETSGFAGAGDPRVWLYSPSTALLTLFDADFSFAFTPADTGTHLIRIAANELVSTGTYDVGITCP